MKMPLVVVCPVIFNSRFVDSRPVTVTAAVGSAPPVVSLTVRIRRPLWFCAYVTVGRMNDRTMARRTTRVMKNLLKGRPQGRPLPGLPGYGEFLRRNPWIDLEPVECGLFSGVCADGAAERSEERRVGKECRSRWWADH